VDPARELVLTLAAAPNAVLEHRSVQRLGGHTASPAQFAGLSDEPIIDPAEAAFVATWPTRAPETAGPTRVATPVMTRLIVLTTRAAAAPPRRCSQ
jgi:hypothetical protein